MLVALCTWRLKNMLFKTWAEIFMKILMKSMAN